MKKYSDEEILNLYKQLPSPPAIVGLILSVLLTVICGAVIMSLWGWFFVPLGLPAITLAHAIGIDLLVTFVVTTTVPKPTLEPFWYRYIFSILMALLTLGGGWVVHLFM